MTLLANPASNKWRRVTFKCRCPICGRPNDCTVSPKCDAVKCARSPSDHPVVQADGRTMWMHPMPGTAAATAGAKFKASEVERLTAVELKEIFKQSRLAMTPPRMKSLCDSLGLSERALKKFDAGFDVRTGCYSFPMRDEKQNVCGFRLRARDGRKLAVSGSRSGLFIANDFDLAAAMPDSDDLAMLLLLPEGPTDAAAAADVGFRAIGRPCCNGGAPMIQRLMARHTGQNVVIVADNDETHFLKNGTPYWPGLEGGLDLARTLMPVCREMRFLLCPDGVKDLRQWVNEGVTAAEMLIEIFGSPLVSNRWLESRYEQLETKRQRNRQVKS